MSKPPQIDTHSLEALLRDVLDRFADFKDHPGLLPADEQVEQRIINAIASLHIYNQNNTQKSSGGVNFDPEA